MEGKFGGTIGGNTTCGDIGEGADGGVEGMDAGEPWARLFVSCGCCNNLVESKSDFSNVICNYNYSGPSSFITITGYIMCIMRFECLFRHMFGW